MWVHQGFLVEVVGVDGAELVQAGHPVSGGVQIRDAGEFQSEAVEGFSGRCAGSAGGVAADGSLDVDEAALDRGVGPAG
ncbi:hypothetical protein A606_00335 [Corynebacterium terpenotabidum Y-11]|uniref:Uncharacterized protein n=1 Tax=Corynebacterium terpenotabidum Y-11 TaxID=1200352 RepID=S4XDQ6_9CORY|nr:hypothetical protein A606_00335 [Corynebacterium terpenotabidum Y-11]